MPLPALEAIIVLSDFVRSWSVDAVHLILLIPLNESKIKAGKGPVRKAGQGVLPAAGKLFSDLSYSQLFVFKGAHEIAS